MMFSQRLPQEFYRGVHERLRERLDDEGLDAFLIDDWRDVAYVTGFFHHPNERPAAVWVHRDRVVLLVPELEREHALAQNVVVDELVAFGEYPGVESPFAVLARTVPGGGVWGHAPTLETGRLQEFGDVFPGVTWRLSRIVERLRLIKQPAEVELHRQAARLGDVMLRAGHDLVVEAASTGELPSEAELADHVVRAGSHWMYEQHSDVVVVPMLTGGLVYAGANSAYPHGLPSSYRIRRGDTFILSLGGAVGGRYAESERTFFLGEPTSEQISYFMADRHAQDAGTSALGPGASCRAVNHACLDIIRQAGFGEHIRHRQGHGIGLNNHEAPWLDDGDDTTLESGMVVSSEPGIYVPGHAGYRISDTVLLTDDGHERLTTFPRALDDIVIDF